MLTEQEIEKLEKIIDLSRQIASYNTKTQLGALINDIGRMKELLAKDIFNR